MLEIDQRTARRLGCAWKGLEGGKGLRPDVKPLAAAAPAAVHQTNTDFFNGIAPEQKSKSTNPSQSNGHTVAVDFTASNERTAFPRALAIWS